MGVGQHGSKATVGGVGVLAMSRTVEGHAYKQQVFSSWEAFLGWKQSEDTLRMPVSSTAA